MKKLLLVIAMVTVSFTINAQENVIKANPLGLLFGSFDVSYERVVSESSAIELSGAFTTRSASLGSESTNFNGFGAGLKYKFYFSDETPRGWYAAPALTYGSMTAKSKDEEGTISIFQAGGVAGYQWVFGGGDTGFSLDLNLGLGYGKVSTEGNVNGLNINGILPMAGLALGYAW